VLEVQLYVRQVRSESFRQYTLVVDNGVASATASAAILPSTSLPVSSSTRQNIPTCAAYFKACSLSSRSFDLILVENDYKYCNYSSASGCIDEVKKIIVDDLFSSVK